MNQISNITDPVVQRAIKELPQAERMAQSFRRNRPNGTVETAGR